MRMTNIPDLGARQLLAIVALADAGSFIGASAVLNVSLPTLSRTVKRVERLVGVMLFERSTRRVEITPAGREFVSISERLLNDLELSLAHMRDVSSEQRGQVVLSTFPIFAQQTLPAIIQDFRSSRPQIELQIRQGCAPDTLEDVCNGRSDFGIAYVEADKLPETVEMVHLWREKLHVIAPSNHPLAKASKTSIALADLKDATLISLPREIHSRRLIDGAAATAGFNLHHSIVVPGFLDILNLVSAGVGVGVVPGSIISERYRSTIKARPLSRPALSMTVGLITLRTKHITPAASSLIKLIVDTVRLQGSPERRLTSAAGTLPTTKIQSFGLVRSCGDPRA